MDPDTCKPQDIQLGKAAVKWRQQRSKYPSKGPFSGIRAIIHTSEARKAAFARLIHAGKGTVLDEAKPPYKDAKAATHCLAEPKKLPGQKMDFEALAQQRVAVVGPLYMNDFLVSEQTNIDEFIIEEYESYWQNFKP